MSPDDPRHGTVAGYRQRCRDTCCRAAIRRYNNTLRLRALRGEPTSSYVPLTGTRRRLQALTRIGYSGTDLATRLGLADRSYLNRITSGNVGGPTKSVTTSFAARVAELYDDLHDQPAPAGKGANRARSRAIRNGWQPPNAWHDIDDDETPIPAKQRSKATGIWSSIDPVVVDRILAGDPTLARTATPAERRTVVARCQTPHPPLSLKRLGELTGWNVDYYKVDGTTTPRPASTTDQSDDTDQETAA